MPQTKPRSFFSPIAIVLMALSSLALVGCSTPSTKSLKSVVTFTHDPPSRTSIRKGLLTDSVLSTLAKRYAGDLGQSPKQMQDQLTRRISVKFDDGQNRELSIEIRCDHNGFGDGFEKQWANAAGVVNTLAEHYVVQQRDRREEAVNRAIESAGKAVASASKKLHDLEFKLLRFELDHKEFGVGDVVSAGRRKRELDTTATRLDGQLVTLASDSEQDETAKKDVETLRSRIARHQRLKERYEQVHRTHRALKQQASKARMALTRARKARSHAEIAAEKTLRGRWIHLAHHAPMSPPGKNETNRKYKTYVK